MSRVDQPRKAWTALVVDDDRGLQGLFNALLSQEGFAVDVAENGRRAFEFLRRGSYSVIFLDLMMPEINGFELLERLANESPMLLRKVIVMTGASQRMADLARASQVWDVVRKPFDIHDLIRSAKACATGRQSYSPAATQTEQRV